MKFDHFVSMWWFVQEFKEERKKKWKIEKRIKRKRKEKEKCQKEENKKGSHQIL